MFVVSGWDYNPVTMSLRFLVGFWWFFVIVVMATYTGNLIAVLAVPKSTLPVQTLAELAAQTQYKYGVMDGSALHTLFMVRRAYYFIFVIYILLDNIFPALTFISIFELTFPG